MRRTPILVKRGGMQFAGGRPSRGHAIDSWAQRLVQTCPELEQVAEQPAVFS